MLVETFPLDVCDKLKVLSIGRAWLFFDAVVFFFCYCLDF